MDSSGHESHPPAQQCPEDAKTEPEANETSVEKHLVPAVGLYVPAVLAEGFGVVGCLLVQPDVPELDAPIALEHRGMGVADDVGVRVVAAMDCGPLPRSDARGEPEQTPTSEGEPGPHCDPAVREGAVEVKGREEEGELARDEARDDSDQEVRHHRNPTRQMSFAPGSRYRTSRVRMFQ